MLYNYLPFLLILFVAASMIGLFTVLAVFIGPKFRSPEKMKPFESGISSEGWQKTKPLQIKFHLIAMIFLVFDAEIVILYPWATRFRELGWPGFIYVSIFLCVLLIGLLYDWKKGGLEWE